MRPTSRPGSRIWQEWITGFGTASRSDMRPPSGDAMPSIPSSRPPVAVAHVPADRHGVVDRAEVHRGVAAADVAVAEQPTPSPPQLGGVLLRRIRQFPNVSQHCAPRSEAADPSWRSAAGPRYRRFQLRGQLQQDRLVGRHQLHPDRQVPASSNAVRESMTRTILRPAGTGNSATRTVGPQNLSLARQAGTTTVR